MRAGSSALQQRGNGSREPCSRAPSSSTALLGGTASRGGSPDQRRPGATGCSPMPFAVASARNARGGARFCVMSALSLAIGITVVVGLVTLVSRSTPPRAKLSARCSLPVGQAQYPVPTNAIFVAPNGNDAASGTRTAPIAHGLGRDRQGRQRGDHRAARRHVPRIGHDPAGQAWHHYPGISGRTGLVRRLNGGLRLDPGRPHLGPQRVDGPLRSQPIVHAR